MSTYYFEPQQKYMGSKWAQTHLGSQVIDWSPSRQEEIGLFHAEFFTPDYNPYIEKPASFQWIKIDSADPDFSDAVNRDTYYIQKWVISSLEPEEQLLATERAREVVEGVVYEKLRETETYITNATINGHNISADLEQYRSQLTGILSSGNVELLAYDFDQENLSALPSLPVNLYNTLDGSLPISTYSKLEIDAMAFGGGGGESLPAGEENEMLVYTSGEWTATPDLAGNAVLLYPVDVLGPTTSFTKTDYGTESIPLSPKVSLYRFGSGGHLINLKADYADNNYTYGDADLNDNRNDDSLEWCAGDIGFWAGDVTDVSRNAAADYHENQFDHIDDDDQAGILASEWVLRDTISGRYWKFDITVWDVSTGNGDDIPDGNVTNGTSTRPPYYTYTRTEYSDPVAGTLDPTTEVTVSVTGWEDADTIDVVDFDPANPTEAIALHRGFNVGFTNPISGGHDGDMYDDLAGVAATYPYLTEMAVVTSWDQVLDPNLQYSRDMDSAYGGGIGNKIVGSKLVVHTLDDDKYHGLSFSAWNQGGTGNGFVCEYGELDVSKNTGIRFADGTVQTTLGGNLNSNRAVWDHHNIGSQNAIAPMPFHLNPGFMKPNWDNDTLTEQPVFDTLAVEPGYALTSFTNQYGSTNTRLQLQNVTSGNIQTSTFYSSGHGITETSSAFISWNTFPTSIDNKRYYRFKLGSFGNKNTCIISAPVAHYNLDVFAKYPSYRTQVAFMNDRAATDFIITFENDHVNLNGFTVPAVATGEVWAIELETMYIDSVHGYKRWITNITQLV